MSMEGSLQRQAVSKMMTLASLHMSIKLLICCQVMAGQNLP